jgi:hypothetical protein
MTKDQIIDSAIEEFKDRFPQTNDRDAFFRNNERKRFQSFLRTKLEEIVFDEMDLLVTIDDYMVNKYPKTEILRPLAKAITAQQAKHRDK